MAEHSSTDSGRGRFFGTFGRDTPSEGLAVASPSRIRKRWKVRTAARARATDEGRYRRPSAYSAPARPLTNPATTPSSAWVASAIPPRSR